MAKNDTPMVRLGQTFTLGELKITPKAVELRKVVSTRDEYGASGPMKFKTETRNPVLVLTYSVENISDGQVFPPWAISHGRDNFGNELVDAISDWYHPDGSQEQNDLAPGKHATIILCLARKIETATSYKWTIHQKVNNRTKYEDGYGYKDWVLTFDATEIGNAGSP